MSANADLLSGLLAYYPLTEISGVRSPSVGGDSVAENGAVGSTVFNPALNPDRQLGRVALFDGTNSLVAASATSYRTGSIYPAVTVCAWFRLDARPAANANFVAKASQNALETNGVDYKLGYNGSVSGGVFFSLPNTAAASSTRSATAPGTRDIDLGRWYFACGRGVYGGPAECRMNLGDWGEANKGSGLPTDPSVSLFSFGCGTSSAGARVEFLTGAVCGVGVWSRILSDAEVGDLYNGGLGLAYPFDWP